MTAKKEKKGGRTKGTPNKVTSEVREAFKGLVDANLGNIQVWLDKTANDDPAKAFDLFLKLSEYVVPKLGRTELVGENGNGINITVTKYK